MVRIFVVVTKYYLQSPIYFAVIAIYMLLWTLLRITLNAYRGGYWNATEEQFHITPLPIRNTGYSFMAVRTSGPASAAS